MKKTVYLLFVLALPLLAAAQSSELGNWLIYIGSKRINDKWNWHNEVQYRNYNAIGDLEQFFVRTGFGYNLAPNNANLLLGYGLFITDSYIAGTDQKNRTTEHRIFQQFTLKQTAGRASFQHRYRLEERFLENVDKVRLRFRYFLALNFPISTKTMEDHTLYLSAYNEIFINPTGSIFDRNRLYGGLGYRFNKYLRMELGYMNQYFNNNTARDQVNVFAFANF